MKTTLVLNHEKIPISVVPVKRAILLILHEKVSWADNSPYMFRSQTQQIPLPYVIALNPDVATSEISELRHKIGFRRAVLVRDNYKCAYCEKFGNTIDHVVPRALNGPNTFENCVAACYSCNSIKADFTLQELGWELKVSPYTPSWDEIAFNRVRKNPDQQAKWAEYLNLQTV